MDPKDIDKITGGAKFVSWVIRMFFLLFFLVGIIMGYLIVNG